MRLDVPEVPRWCDRSSRIDEGSCGIMDQHQVGRVTGQAFHPLRTEAWRVSPPIAGGSRARPAGCGIIERAIAVIDHDLHAIDARCAAKVSGNAAATAAGERQELLRQFAAMRSPLPAATTSAIT